MYSVGWKTANPRAQGPARARRGVVSFPAELLRACAVSVAIGFSLAVPAVGPAAAADPVRDASPRGAGRDIEAEVKARKALRGDPQLGPLNLWVTVKSGVATVKGAVPADELIQRAILAVQHVPGVQKVRSELYVAVSGKRGEPLRLPLDFDPPAQTQSASPDPDTGTLGALGSGSAGPAPATQTAPPVRDPVAPQTASPTPSGTVTLLPPLGISGPLRSQDVTRSVAGTRPERTASVVLAIERLRQTDQRFRRIQTEIRDKTIVLIPGETAGEDLMAFAQALAHLPGVERVVVRSGPAP
jgi:hypothetical protein